MKRDIPRITKNIHIKFEILNIVILKRRLNNKIKRGNIIEIKDNNKRELANSKQNFHKINFECPLSW